MYSFPHPPWACCLAAVPLPISDTSPQRVTWENCWGMAGAPLCNIGQAGICKKQCDTWELYMGGEAVVQSVAGSVPMKKRGPWMGLLQDLINPTEGVGCAAGLGPCIFPIPPCARCLLKPVVQAGPGCLCWARWGC